MQNHLKQIVSIGIIAGMRSMMAPAAAATFLHRKRKTPGNAVLDKIFTSSAGLKVLNALAAGELMGDKLPTAPNRIATPGLVGRIVTGSLAAASISKANNKNVIAGALIGGGVAAASTYAFFYLRRYISSHPKVKDYFTGAAEDAVALGLSALVAK